MEAKNFIAIAIGIGLGIAAQLAFFPTPLSSTSTQPGESPSPRKTLSALSNGSRSATEASRSLKERGIDLAQFDGPATDDGSYAAYLARHQYSKEALLAVFLLTRDDAHLLEAARRYPDDPNVQLLVICRQVLPEEQDEWIRRFKASQPDNMLSSIFLAGQFLERGDTGAALAEFRSALDARGCEDFSTQGSLAMDSALIELGCPTLEAKYRSMPLHAHTVVVNPMNSRLKMLREATEKTESDEKRIELASLGIALGRRLSHGEESSLILNHMVGLGKTNEFVEMLDPETPLPDLGMTAAEVEQEAEQSKAKFPIYQQAWERIDELSEQQYIHFLDRSRNEGSFAGLQWLTEHFGIPLEAEEQ